MVLEGLRSRLRALSFRSNACSTNIGEGVSCGWVGVGARGPRPEASVGSADECARALVESIAVAAAQMASLRAQQLREVAALTARMATLIEPPEMPEQMPSTSEVCGVDAAAAELSARLRIHLNSAYRLVDLALALTTRSPGTFEALAQGRIDEAKAKAVVAATELLSDAGAVVVEEAVAATIESSTVAGLKAQLAHEVHDLDPAAVDRRARRATADRHLRFTALANGMAELSLVGPATVLRPLYDKADALARDRSRLRGRIDPLAGVVHGDGVPLGPDGQPLDRRGVDARRSDASTDLLAQPLATAPGVGQSTGAHITVAFTSALGECPGGRRRSSSVERLRGDLAGLRR